MAISNTLNVRFQPDTRTSGPGRSAPANVDKPGATEPELIPNCIGRTKMKFNFCTAIDAIALRHGSLVLVDCDGPFCVRIFSLSRS